MLSWIHFGDLHVTRDDGYESAAHLARLVAVANQQVGDAVDFAYLPGDNANNGTAEQYARIRAALAGLRVPVHAVPGDHDFEPASLAAFHDGLAPYALPRMIRVRGHRCLFLDVVSAGRGGPDFRLDEAQTHWLDAQLRAARDDAERPVVFMHAYPEDLAAGGEELARRFAEARVAMVDTGHTHYNELLNDGSVVYAATRSTGQIEEDAGHPGLSLAVVDGGTASWRFHRLADPWPVVMITRPADARLVTDPADAGQVPATTCVVRAKVFGAHAGEVVASIGDAHVPMHSVAGERALWQARLAVPTDVARYRLTVTATAEDGAPASDTLTVLTARGAAHRDGANAHGAPPGTSAHAVGEWREHGLLGSQLGPNKNGRDW